MLQLMNVTHHLTVGFKDGWVSSFITILNYSLNFTNFIDLGNHRNCVLTFLSASYGQFD